MLRKQALGKFTISLNYAAIFTTHRSTARDSGVLELGNNVVPESSIKATALSTTATTVQSNMQAEI